MFERFFGSIIPLDTQLLLRINDLPHFLIVDILLFCITAITTYGIFWLATAFLLKRRQDLAGLFRVTVIFIILSFILVEVFLKGVFERSRPSLLFPSINTVGPRLAELFSSSSFPSGHAYIAFGFIPIFTAFNKRFLGPLLLLALLVAFSRIYFGKHYPFDVFAGGILGLSIGWLFSWAIRRTQKL